MANWRIIAGETNWTGLLGSDKDNNLDGNLSQRVVECGQRVKVIYDSIDENKRSSNYGLPLFAKEALFSEVGPDKYREHKLYEVKEYIFALADVVSTADWIVNDRSVWMGYVAVATNKGKQELGTRDILICWRGTQFTAEWLKNLQFSQVPDSNIFKNSKGNAYVHKGFHSLYTKSAANAPHNIISARNQVMDAVTHLVNQYKDEDISITVTGHSLGAALATLNAVDIVANDKNKVKNKETGQVLKQFLVTAFVFASPMVGNRGFKDLFEKLPNLHLLQINHLCDTVPDLPLNLRGIVYCKTGFMKVFNSVCSNFPNYLFSLFGMKTYFHSLENLLRTIKEASETGRSIAYQNYYALVEEANGDLKLIEVPPTS